MNAAILKGLSRILKRRHLKPVTIFSEISEEDPSGRILAAISERVVFQIAVDMPTMSIAVIDHGLHMCHKVLDLESPNSFEMMENDLEQVLLLDAYEQRRTCWFGKCYYHRQ